MDQIYVLYEKYVWVFSLFMKNENCGDIIFSFVNLNLWNEVFDSGFYDPSQWVTIIDISMTLVNML